MIRFLLRAYFKLFRVRVYWLEKASALPTPVIYMANHVSSWDVLFLYAFLPGHLCFALNPTTIRQKRIRILMHFADLLPFNPLDPISIKNLLAKLEAGQSCVIFAEGKITETGSLMKIYEAPGILADKANVPLVPVWITGTRHGYCSRMQQKHIFRMLPKTTITIQKPVVFKIKEETRRDRNYISNELYRLMLDISFRATYKPEASFFSELMQTAKNNAHNGLFSRPTFVEDTQRVPHSYKDIIVKSYLYGRFLKKIADRQEHLGVLLPNSIDNLCVLIGLMAYERVPAMLNFSSGLANVVSTSKTAVLKSVLTSRTFIEEQKLTPIVDALTANGVRILYLEDIKKSIGLFARLKAWISYKFKYVPYPKSGTQKALVLFTSGSEGSPKAVVLSHQNILSNIRQLASLVDINETDTMFNMLPMFHSYGLVGGTFYPLLCGGKLFLYPSPLHYRIVPELVYEIGATMMFGTDAFFKSYAKVAHPFDFHTLRFVLGGAEAIKKETRDIYMERFGVRLFEAYGATETSPFLTTNNATFCRFGSIGQIMPAIEYKLSPVSGIEKGGSLCVKGPNIMMGYMFADNPGVLVPPTDGWYDTGDVVEVDDMGFFYIRDRVKRFAKIAGEMISLTSVEKIAAAVTPDSTFEYGAVAVPHETKGEQIVLVSTNKDLKIQDLQQLIQKEGYSELYLPRVILYRDALPIFGSGKRDNITLKKEVLAEMSHS